MKKQTKKKIINAGITVVLLCSLIAAVAFATETTKPKTIKVNSEDKSNEIYTTGDYDSQALAEGSFAPSASDVEVGDDFSVTFYIDTSGDTTTGFTIRQLLFNTTTVGLANITTNDAGTPGASYNISFGSTWYDATFNDDGDLDNSTGNLTYIIANKLAGVSGNNSAVIINFTANNAGLLEIRIPYTIWSGQPGLAVDGVTPDTWTNTSVTIHPANPTGFTATTYNWTAINLSWNTPTNPLDNTTVCGKSGSYPTGPSDSVLYNGSNLTYNHTDLNNCTTYYYRAWSYNTSTGMHSLLNDSQTAMTSCYTNVSFHGENPTNTSTTTNCSYAFSVNVTIRNSKGKIMDYWINASNGQTTSGSTVNSSVSLALTGLSHQTQYWWNVTASEQSNPSDSLTAGYTFTTGQGGGTAPSAATPYPETGNTSLPINEINLSVIVTDADGDDVNTTFKWSNGTTIGYVNFTGSGSRVWCNKTLTLNYNTTYTWYVSTRDACSSADSSSWTFTTDEDLLYATKEWTVLTNNTILSWINITNVGEANIQNAYINDTYDSDTIFIGSTPANDSGDTGKWTISWINTTGSNQWYNVTTWTNLSGPIANGTTISNNGTINYASTNTFSTASDLTMCYWATKEPNMTSLDANTTQVNFSINITNCGDFYLNWVQVNESYPANYTYNNSNVTGNGTNETFNITQIAPGVTYYMGLTLNTTFGDGGGILENGSRIWNNITIDSNETLYPYYRNTSLYVGARTTMLRITYTTIYYDMVGLTNTIFGIVGIILIISTILLIVGMMYVYRGGGLGGLGGEGEWRG